MKKMVACLMIISLLFISGCNISNSSLNNSGNGTTENGGNGTTENSGNGTIENGGSGTTNVVDDGMLRTVLNGGGQGAVSLPYYVSTEIVKRCLITDKTVNAKIYLGHDEWFDDLVYFTDLERSLTVNELKPKISQVLYLYKKQLLFTFSNCFYFTFFY